MRFFLEGQDPNKDFQIENAKSVKIEETVFADGLSKDRLFEKTENVFQAFRLLETMFQRWIDEPISKASTSISPASSEMIGWREG